MADTDRPDESHEQTLSLLRSLGFVRTPEQAAEYRAKIAAAAKKNTPENWAKVRERLGLPVRVV